MCNRLQLLTKPLSLLYAIGFIDYRSRFHISRHFYSFQIHHALYILQSTTLAELIRIRKRKKIKKRGCVITPVNDTPSIKY